MTAVGKDTLDTRDTLHGRRQELRLLFAGQGRREARRRLAPALLDEGAAREPAALRGRRSPSPSTTSRRSSTGRRNAASDREIQYRPARVLMQDFTGVPCVVDLAAMRDAIAKLGGDAQKINPLVPVHLVIDHSVMVDEFGTPQGVRGERRARISAQHRALRIPQMGLEERSTISRSCRRAPASATRSISKISPRRCGRRTDPGRARRSPIPTPASAPTATPR